jgi:hypothetical protein
VIVDVILRRAGCQPQDKTTAFPVAGDLLLVELLRAAVAIAGVATWTAALLVLG